MTTRTVQATGRLDRTYRDSSRAAIGLDDGELRVPDAQLDMVCCLEQPLRSRLVSRTPSSFIPVPCQRLVDLANGGGLRLVIADPSTENGNCGRLLLQLCNTCPSTLIVLYVALRPSVMSSVVELAQHGVRDVVLWGVDDTSQRFGEIIERSAANRSTQTILRELEANLSRAPQRLVWAVREMFEAPRRFPTVDHLAAAAGMHRRTLYRRLSEAGIASPRLLVASARVFRAATLLSESAQSVRDIAASLGYSKPEILALHLKRLTNLRPRDLRRSPIAATLPREIVARIVAG